MKELSLMYFDISTSATILLILVLLIRLCFKKGPRKFYFALWILCGIRLFVPFTIESNYSLVPPSVHMTTNMIQALPVDLSMDTTMPLYHNAAISYSLSDVLSIIWLFGCIVMITYFVVSYLSLYRKTRQSILYQDNVYLCDEIDTPFVLGVFQPKIYIPSDLNEAYYEHIIAHEKTHIQHKDYLWKFISYIILTIHWYNIFVWEAYFLFQKDIECFCDEKVVQNYQNDQKKSYLDTLLACSIHQKTFMHFTCGFSQSDVKKRVENIIHHRKPTVFILVLSVLLCVVVACLCMTQQPDTRWYPIYEEISSKFSERIEQQYNIYLRNNDELYQIQNNEDGKKEFNECIDFLKEIIVKPNAMTNDKTIESKFQIRTESHKTMIHFNEDCTLVWVESYDPSNETTIYSDMYQIKNASHIQKYFQKEPGQLCGNIFIPEGQNNLAGLKVESFELDRYEKYISVTWLNTSDHAIKVPHGYDLLKKYDDGTYKSLKHPSATMPDGEPSLLEAGERLRSTYGIENFDLPSEGHFKFVILQDNKVVGFYNFFDYIKD